VPLGTGSPHPLMRRVQVIAHRHFDELVDVQAPQTTDRARGIDRRPVGRLAPGQRPEQGEIRHAPLGCRSALPLRCPTFVY